MINIKQTAMGDYTGGYTGGYTGFQSEPLGDVTLRIYGKQKAKSYSLDRRWF